MQVLCNGLVIIENKRFLATGINVEFNVFSSSHLQFHWLCFASHRVRFEAMSMASSISDCGSIVDKLSEFAVIDSPDIKNLDDFRRETASMEWAEVGETTSPWQSLHNWLIEVAKKFHRDMSVYCYESLYFIVAEWQVDLTNKSAAVLLFDVYDQQSKIILFR